MPPTSTHRGGEDVETVLEAHPAVRRAMVTSVDGNLHAVIVPEAAAVSSGLSPTMALQCWELVYDGLRSGAKQDDASEFAGWNSTYTGMPLPSADMREWAETTVERITAEGGKTFLEIGCGIGILLRRLLPSCQSYFATDLSRKTIQDLDGMLPSDLRHKARIQHSEARKASDVVLSCPEARVSPSIDTVVLNSVVQYFPGFDYLLEVINPAVDLVRPGGTIFIGDIRSLRLLDIFSCSVELRRAADSDQGQDVARRVDSRRATDSELLMDPEVFAALAMEDPRISRVEVLPRDGVCDNEMTRFRYDAVLHIGDKIAPLPVQSWCDGAADAFDEACLAATLDSAPEEAFGIRAIPNRRVHGDARAWELLQAHPERQVLELLRETREAPAQGLDPTRVRQLAAEKGWVAEVSWARAHPDGAFDAVFRRDGRRGWHDFGTDLNDVDVAHHTSDATARRIREKVRADIIEWTVEHLPPERRPATCTMLGGYPDAAAE